MRTIKVLLADDHKLVRGGIRALLNEIAGVEVVAEANDGREALEKTASFSPDVVMMDIAMSGMNGLEATIRLTKEFPLTNVIILSMHTNEEYVLQALRSGAKGYLLKDADIAELELALQAVSLGETYLSPRISRHVISEYVRRVGAEMERSEEPSPLQLLDRLTPRQREILQLIAEGKKTNEIAEMLNISVKTVETHRTQLMERLDIHEIAGLVRFAIRVGLVTIDE